MRSRVLVSVYTQDYLEASGQRAELQDDFAYVFYPRHNDFSVLGRRFVLCEAVRRTREQV